MIKKRKMLNFQFLCFLCLFFFTTNLQANNNVQNLKLFSDTAFNEIFFSTAMSDSILKINQSIKLEGEPAWGSNFIVSDPAVNVIAYNVRKDSNDNFVVGWIGENTSLGIYSLYMRYYMKNTDTWSSIITASSPTQNLEGNFVISINTLAINVIWTIYDEDFNIQKESATYTL